MSGMPVVLGLSPEDAVRRLETAGFSGAEIRVSGRRREGRPRVIRQRMEEGRLELVASYFKDLKIEEN